MRTAVRELVRRPGRFVTVGSALTVLVLLLLFLGGLLDGLYLNSTGAVRALGADAVVFSDDARQSFLRSDIPVDVRTTIEGVDGVAEVGGLSVTLLGVRISDTDGGDVLDAAVIGYELASGSLPEPPAVGEAFVDRRLADEGADEGDEIRIGPAETTVTVVGFVEDTNYLQQAGVWVAPSTWREIQTANRPDATIAEDSFQALVVRGDDGTDPAELRVAIDEATGATESLSQSAAVSAIPGIDEQNATFTAIIGVTVFVAGLVVALFFALITLERLGLYAVLKAFGGSSRTLVAGVVLQSVAVTVTAFVAGAILTIGLIQIVPDEIPLQLEPSRALTTFASVVIAAIIGALISLRRIVRIDPASAIGAGV